MDIFIRSFLLLLYVSSTKFTGVLSRELIFRQRIKTWEQLESSVSLGYIHNLFIIFKYNNFVTYLTYL
jgi:hypothetical protein